MRISPLSRSYLRKRSNRLMEDACRIVRPIIGHVVYDPVTKVATNTTSEEIYSGPCRLWEVSAGSITQVGEEEFVQTSLRLSLPWDVFTIPAVEDTFEVTKSDDSSLVGKWFEILSHTKGGGLRGSRVFTVRYLEKVGR